ncbi:MAG: helix-turn-helix transcriptional regulator [Acidimicrobiia bacterium]
MADTTARVLRLLSLLQARRTWSGGELMGRLEVSERTLRRDIDRLRELGYPVRATTGPTGGYQLEAGADIPPLLLDEEEAVAIAIGLRTAAGGTIAGIEETSVRALAKLETVLPPRIRRQINTLQTTVVPVIRPWVTVDAEILTAVAQACRDNERIRFEYSARDGERSERNVEPHRLVSIHQRWYLLAFDRDRDDWRTFRLDRMASPWATRARFKPRPIPGGDAAEYVQQSLQARPTRYEVTATLEAPATEIEERLHHGQGRVEPIGDDRCVIHLEGDYLEWLAFQILWLAVDFEIHDPPELVDYMTGLSARLSRTLA